MALTPEQQAFRRTGIGSADIAAIAGFDAYRTGWQVQQEKRGLSQFKGNIFTWSGEALEPVVARQYAEDNANMQIVQGATGRHPEFPLAIATPDYLVTSALNGSRKVLEIKCVFSPAISRLWGMPESDQIPYHHYVQVQWQLGVMRIGDADVARFYNARVNYWRVNYNAAIFAMLKELASRWWERHMIKGEDCIPSGPDLKQLREGAHPYNVRKDYETATPQEEIFLRRWRDAYRALERAEEEEKDAQAKVLALLQKRRAIQTEDRSIKVSFNQASGPSSTAWPALALEKGATPEDVLRHTRRGFSFRKPWASFWREEKEAKQIPPAITGEKK